MTDPVDLKAVVRVDKRLKFTLEITNQDSTDCPIVHILANFSPEVPGSIDHWGMEANQLLSMEASLSGQGTKIITRDIYIPNAVPGVTNLTLNVVNSYTGLSAPPITLEVTVL